MPLEIQERDGVCLARVNEEMTINTAAALFGEFKLLFAGTGNVEVNLSGVGEIDTAGLQLMLMLKCCMGSALRFTGHSRAVLQALETSNLYGQLGDPVVIPNGDADSRRNRP